jgi:hypothetical protein
MLAERRSRVSGRAPADSLVKAEKAMAIYLTATEIVG